MKINIELTAEQLSDVVSKELMNLYDDMKADNMLLMGTESGNEDALKYLRHMVEYYTAPAEFEKWMNAE